MYLEEREFWDELPLIIEALLRRWLVWNGIRFEWRANLTQYKQVRGFDRYAYEK